MGKLIYNITTSLDGYAADKNGNIDWGKPSEEVHAFINDTLRGTGTFLFGRKVYETMAVWDSITDDGPSAGMNGFAKIWEGANKIVYSSQLKTVKTKNTILERSFDPEAVRKMVAESDKDFGIGGPHLAADAIRAGSIDEYHQSIVPILLGGGTHWLPDDISRELELVDVRKFENGTIHLSYKPVR